MNSLHPALKSALAAKAKSILESQILNLKDQLAALKEDGEHEEKSSAGDKYETQREMINQSRTILEKRLGSSQVMLNQLNAVQEKQMDQVQEGSLIKLPIGYIWVSVPMGKVTLNGIDYQLVSKDSPLITVIFGLKKGERIDFRGKAIEIEEIV